MSVIREIAETIEEQGIDGLWLAGKQFENGTIERRLLRRTLPVYRTAPLEKHHRDVDVRYADADFCLFELDQNEEVTFVDGENDDPAPTWWLLGTDDLRESGLTLLEYPGETDREGRWTRSDVLDGLDLDSWQSITTEQAHDLEMDTRYRLSGRLGITRLDADEYLAKVQDSDWIDLDWDKIERFRDTAATQIASHLLTFEDASAIGPSFDPHQDLDNGEFVVQGFMQMAYVTEGTSVCIVSERYRNRHLELGEGIYRFPKIGVRRPQQARHPSYKPPSHNNQQTTTTLSSTSTDSPTSGREFLTAVFDSFRAWRANDSTSAQKGWGS